MDLEHPARRKPAEQRLAHAGGIDPGALGEEQRLGRGLDVQGDHDLVGGLGHLPGPRWADVRGRLAQDVEERLGPAHGGLVAAGHDRQLPVARGGLAAGHGSVDGLHPALRERLVDAPRHRRRDGRHVDEQRALADSLGHPAFPQDDGLDVGRVGEHGDNDVNVGGQGGGPVGCLRAVGHERVDGGPAAVVDHEREARLEQVGRHRRAHDPQPDEPDALHHRCLQPS